MTIPFLTDAAQKEAEEELKKVFVLAAEGLEVEMFSTGIDAVWHELLRDEESYKKFCIDACGKVIGHAETKGFGLITFVQSYEKRYGKFPKVWFTNHNGIFDEERYNHYMRTGIVISGWDCTPDHNCLRVAVD